MRPEELGIGNLFEKVRDAVVVADARTQRMILWNPAAERVFGYSTSEALKLRVEALVPEALKDAHRSGIARYAETGHGRYIDSHRLLDLPAITKDGEEIRVELSLSPINPVDEADSGGRFVLAIIRDSTERKRTEEALIRE
jgi:PAS domain S-box-containing protein